MVKKGYRQTESGVIPEDWETSSLSAAFQKLEAGVSVNSDDSLFSEYHILKTSAVHDGVVDTAETKPVIPQDYSRLKCPLVKGSIIISRMNTPALVGECGFTKDVKAGTYLPDRLWQIQNSNKSSFDFVWLNYLLNTKQYRDAVRATATGTSNSMKNISKERLLDIEIPCPPIGEQENIAAVLSEVDELINLIEKQISKKKAIKQGAMQELLTGKRRLPGFSGEIAYQPLKSLCTVFSDGDWIESKDQSSDGVRLIQTGNIGKGRYIDKQDKQRFISVGTFNRLNCFEIFEGDVLVSRLPDPAGRACILPPSNKRRITAVDCTVVRFSSYNPVLFVAYSQTKQYQEKVEIVMAGSTRQRISRKELGEIPIPVFPTIEEQNTLASIFANMDAEIEALEQKLAKYRQVKQGMMQQLLTGKIRIV